MIFPVLTMISTWCRYVIDAKSIMGIFSLDLSKPIELNIHAEEGADEVIDMLKPYIV